MMVVISRTFKTVGLSSVLLGCQNLQVPRHMKTADKRVIQWDDVINFVINSRL